MTGFNGDTKDSTDVHDLTAGKATYGEDRFGKPNHTDYFDGTDAYAYTSHFALPDSFTISFWIKASTQTQNGVILANGNVLSDGISFLINNKIASDSAGFPIAGNDTYPYISGDRSFDLGQNTDTSKWYFYAISYKSNTLTYYYGSYYTGLYQTAYGFSDTVTMKNATGDFSVGAGWNGTIYGAYFNGLVDDVRIYSRVLSNSEITDLLNEEPLDVAELKTSAHFSVYPNPANEDFYVRADDNMNGSTYTIQVNNVIGQEVYSKASSSINNKISLDKNAPGIYFLSVYDSEHHLLANKKILVQ